MRGGAAGLAFLRVAAGGQLEGAKAIRDGLQAEQVAQMVDLCGAAEGDLLLIAAGDTAVVNRCVPASGRMVRYRRAPEAQGQRTERACVRARVLGTVTVSGML